MNHLTLYTEEFFTGIALAVPFVITILLYANYKVNTMTNG